jgi:hypothetical protein
MAITTVDGALAGMRPLEPFAKALSGTLVAGRPYTPFYAAGVPGAAVAPAPGIAGAALTTYAGQIPVPAASANTHLARLRASMSAQAGTLLLCDRLWHNSGVNVTLTTAQAVNSVAWPARSADGTVNGDKVLIGVEVSGATGAGTPTLTLGYTNSAGTAGRTATNIDAAGATSAVGSFYRMGLQAGDVGVRSLQSFTLSATWTSGTIHLVAYRVLAELELSGAGIPNAIDALTGGLPRLYDNSVPFFLFIPQTTTTTQVSASLVFTQG